MGLSSYQGHDGKPYEEKLEEMTGSIVDLKHAVDNLFHQDWTSKDLQKVKEIAEKIMQDADSLQKESFTFSHHYEVLNRIQDKINDYVVNPVTGLLSPGTTESSPKELWGAIFSTFYGPWSIDHELKMLKD